MVISGNLKSVIPFSGVLGISKLTLCQFPNIPGMTAKWDGMPE